MNDQVYYLSYAAAYKFIKLHCKNEGGKQLASKVNTASTRTIIAGRQLYPVDGRGGRQTIWSFLQPGHKPVAKKQACFCFIPRVPQRLPETSDKEWFDPEDNPE